MTEIRRGRELPGGIEILHSSGLQVVASLPSGEDPDTFSRKHGTVGVRLAE